MKFQLAFVVLAGALGLQGCATPDTKADAAPKAEKSDVYLTGSRLPRKSGGDQPLSTVSGDEWRRSQSGAASQLPPGM